MNESELESKPVYVAIINADLTEGRSYNYPLAVCEKKATAIRLGHKKNVMSSNAYIEEDKAYKINGNWYIPGRIMPPNLEDDRKQKILDAKSAAIEKAKKAGLTDEDIKAISHVQWGGAT